MAKNTSFYSLIAIRKVFKPVFAVVQLHSEQLSQTTQQKNTQCEKTDNGEENG